MLATKYGNSFMTIESDEVELNLTWTKIIWINNLMLIILRKKFKEIKNILMKTQSQKYILDFFELFRNIMSIRLFIHIILISTMLKITFQNIKALTWTIEFKHLKSEDMKEGTLFNVHTSDELPL